MQTRTMKILMTSIRVRPPVLQLTVSRRMKTHPRSTRLDIFSHSAWKCTTVDTILKRFHTFTENKCNKRCMNLIDPMYMLTAFGARSIKVLQSLHGSAWGAQIVDLCKFRMEKYSIQSRFYKLTEKKCALIFCIVTAAVCVALMTCLLALSVSGKLGPSKSPEAAGSGSSLQVSQC